MWSEPYRSVRLRLHDVYVHCSAVDIVKQGDVPGGAVIIGGRYTTWVSPGAKTVRFAIAGSREGLKPEDETPNATPPKYDKEPLQIDVRKNGVYDFPLTSK